MSDEALPTLSVDAFMTARAQVPDHVVFREYDGETVVLNLQSGTYHGTNEAGGRLLGLLRDAGAKAPVGDSVNKLAADYGEPAERIAPGLRDFAVSLTERGLIELDVPSD